MSLCVCALACTFLGCLVCACAVECCCVRLLMLSARRVALLWQLGKVCLNPFSDGFGGSAESRRASSARGHPHSVQPGRKRDAKP